MKHVQTAIRVPETWLKRLDKLAASMSQPGLTPVTRSEAHRLALDEGMAKLESRKKKR